jgi:O-antigen/teichoic acid export membrane protein
MGAHLFKAMAGSAGLRVVGMAFAFLVGVQLARGLGPAGYGIYGTAMSMVAVLMIPTEMGLPQLVMREVSAALALNEAGATGAIVGWARRAVLQSSLVIAGFAFVVLSIGAYSVEPPVRTALAVGLIWIPVVAIGNIYGAALRGMRRVVSGQLSEIVIRPAIVSLCLFLLTWYAAPRLSPASAMGINVVAAIIAGTVSMFLLTRAETHRADASRAIPHGLRLSHALPIAMTEGMRVLAAQVSVLVLAAMATQEAVGLYRVAYGIYVAAAMPSTLINVACAPTISRLFTQGRTQELERLNVLASLFMGCAAAAAVFVNYCYGGAAVSMLFGTEYADAAGILSILLVGEFGASLFGHPTVVLNMMRRQRVVMWWSAAALIVNFVSSWLLVEAVGYVGAAVGCVAGQIVWRAGCAFYAKRRLGLDTSVITKFVSKGADR